MTLDDAIDNLARIPLFSMFEPNALRMLASSADTRLLRAGDILFRRGEMSDGGYVLAVGSIALDLHDDGRPQPIIVRPWTLIGESALVAASLRPATAIAREPAVTLKIMRPLFHLILEQHPTTAARVRDFFRRRLLEFIRDTGGDASASDIVAGRLT
ncbi:cyclic nucleotide-binding domain-containing protein [Methylocystis sp.]|jgi:CRP-like cAMP-binding protein|uniref:cyclic nucleotide-binding domain-containing protein n=1 Tax=Methylocystis sp. TaxID=1911079 RepID=UPI0025D2CAD1|nr:cyclic nucleotide-binding domain-containing protein [Methylocystis sp.]